MKTYILVLCLFISVCKGGGIAPLIGESELESIVKNASASCEKYIEVLIKNGEKTCRQKGMEVLITKRNIKDLMHDGLVLAGLSKCFGVSLATMQKQYFVATLLCQLTHYNFDGALKDIEDYVVKIRKCPTQNYKPSRLAEICLEMYESKEYQSEIKNIVNKYCVAYPYYQYITT